jgi:nucleoside-diphosphate-sugar epimerase
MRGARFVLHQAALPSVKRSVTDPIESDRINVRGTLSVLVAARDAGVRRLVYASSSSVYGDTPTLPKHEDMTPTPMSPYAVSKLTGEYYARIFPALYGLETVALRYFNVFGPRQDPGSPYAAVIPIFVERMLDGRPPIIYGDGAQSRDFTFVGNVVRANLAACEAPGASGGVFNVGAGSRTTLLGLVDELNALLGTNLAPIHEPPRAGDVRDSQADIGRAAETLGYQVETPFREGLAQTVAWYREALGS